MSNATQTTTKSDLAKEYYGDAGMTDSDLVLCHLTARAKLGKPRSFAATNSVGGIMDATGLGADEIEALLPGIGAKLVRQTKTHIAANGICPRWAVSL